MAEALAKPENRKLYRKRKPTAEPVFGQIKEARGFRQFSSEASRRSGQSGGSWPSATTS